MADDTSTGLLGQAVPPSNIDPAMLEQLQRKLLAPVPAVQPDRTPVEHDWRYWLGRVGNAMGGSGVIDSLSPAEQQAAGLRALGSFSTGLMQSARYEPGKTIFSNLGEGFAAADRSVAGSEREGARVLAGRQAALTESQKQQIEGIKAALPLLTLQGQQAAVRGMPGSLLGPNVGSVGADTYVGAIGGHEGTGQNPNSSAVGVGQFLDSTWMDFAKANPQYFTGMTPEQALAARKDPAFGAKVGPVAIEWLAKQNADALTKAGVPPSGSVLGIAHYLGAGAAASIAKAPDSAMVSSFVPAAAVAANPELKTMTVGQMKARYANTPNPTFMAGAPAAPTPVGQNPGGKVQIPPPTAAAPGTPTVAPGQAAPTVAPAGRGTLPPPEPAMAGTAQVAGNVGAPTSGVIPPSPPGSAADVADIKAGMVAAGADPNTLAAGPGSKPGVPPAVATAQLSPLPPGMDANSREAYGILHPIVPPPEMQKLFNPQPDPDQMAAIQARKLNAERDYQAAKAGKDPIAATAAARALFDKATADENTLRENARKLGTETKANFYKERSAALDTAWAAEQKQRDELAASQRTQDFELRKIEATGRETRLNTEAGSIVESNKRVRDSLGDDATAAAKTIPNLEGLRALSDNVGPNDADLTKLATVPFMGTSLLNHMATLGLVDKTKAGAIQMLQGGISGTVAQLRQGMSMGALSDRDLTFIESLGPNLYEDQATRSAVISYLQQSQRAKIRFNNEFNEEMTKPGANAAKALAAARETMDAKHPIVPQMTPEVAAIWTDPSPEAAATRKQWAARHGVKQNTLVRQPDGSLLLVK
jgi:hypothetical protein